MVIIINENIKIWRKYNPFEFFQNDILYQSFGSRRNLENFCSNNERIAIKDRWFDVLTRGELIRNRNKCDGYFRVVYIQINMENKNKISGEIHSHTGVEVARCYQCGKCTAGCVLASEMNFPPSYLMRLLQTGTEENYDRILRSNTIWLCLNCENCLGR